MQDISFQVDGGSLHAVRFGDGPQVVLAAHGITGNALSWAAVADALPEDWSMVAVDLRGRGRSRDLPGPYGLRAHARDLTDVASQIGTPVVLTGHSMGAYIGVHAAHDHPELFTRVVLVDGGVSLPLPAEVDPDEVLAATLGPALARLSQTYPSEDAYVDFFRAHPALASHWNPVVEEYVRGDALPVEDGVRSRANEEAVRADGRDLLVDGASFEPELLATALPVEILAAPSGMFGDPPGLLPTAGLAAYDDVDHVSVSVVPGTNHYTIVFDPDAAALVAAALRR